MTFYLFCRLTRKKLNEEWSKMPINTDKTYRLRGRSGLLKASPYRQSSVEARPHHKLSKQYFGPYKVNKTWTRCLWTITTRFLTYSPTIPCITTETSYGRDKLTAESLTPYSIGNNPLLQPVAILDSKPKNNDSLWDKLVLVQRERWPLEDILGKNFSNCSELTSTSTLRTRCAATRSEDTTHNLDTEDQEEHILPQLNDRAQTNVDSVEELSQQWTNKVC